MEKEFTKLKIQLLNKEIKEQYITFETAKLAKEKGFNNVTDPSYLLENGNVECLGFATPSVVYSDKYISRPTQSLLQRWLREKYQIFIEVVTDCTCEPKFAFYINKFIGNPEDLTEREWKWEEIHPKEWYLYRTWEEALEEGLKEAILTI